MKISLRTAVLVAVVLSSLLSAQTPRTIQIAVSVLDKDGRNVNDLTRESFQLFEDKVPQEISLFRRDDLPVSIGLVLDDSGSMRNKRQRLNTAVLPLVAESNPESETFIVSFGDTAVLDQGFTSSVANLMDALGQLKSRGQTALFDAIFLSIDKLTKDGRRESKSLVLVSDGEDNASKNNRDAALKRLKESSITLYAIGLVDENDRRPGIFAARPSSKARQLLQEWADITGGAAYFPKSIDEIEQISKDIARDLRNRYTLGYRSTNTNRDGAWREVRVALKTPTSKTSVRHRPGYYATGN